MIPMNSYKKNRGSRNLGLTILLILVMIIFAVCSDAQAAAAKQKSFSSAEEAINAMIEALKEGNEKVLLAIFGPQGKTLISSGDEVADRRGRENLIKYCEEGKKVVTVGDRKAVLYVGKEEWPFPVPVVKKGKSWRFDTKAGKQEIIDRRVGGNELATIQACLAFVDAQREYALKDMDKDGLFEYARKFMSDPGKKNGLYWETKEGEEPSPLGAFFASAWKEGYRPKGQQESTPYHGYFFRILPGQGKNASKGAFDYIVDDKMIGGFALVAYPAQYGVSGIMTFMVNQDGVVYEKNLGKRTERIARAMKVFDPDKTWQKVKSSE
jgi:type II secretory pathway pseudopilin PulG